MNIICFLWRHDWEKIKTLNEEEILRNISTTLNEKLPKGNYKKEFHKKVCLRCGSKKDEINNYFTNFILERKKEKIRKQAAQDIWRHT
jgi:hypothetical protein